MTSLHHLDEGSGPVVVLLHAGVADLRMWDAQVAALPGRRTVRCDLMGYGGTPVDPQMTSGDAEQVLGLLDELRVDRFGLVGASYGGYVALQVASAVPERVERLVLLATAADLGEPDEQLRQLWRREEELVEAGDLVGASELTVESWLGPDADEDARALVRDMQLQAYRLQGDVGDDPEDRELPVDLARITAPATLVVGHHDFPLFRTIASTLAERLPTAELVELPWAGHLPSLERPTETAELVARLLG